MELKSFSIDYDVIKASGTVTYTVKAKTRDEAIDLLKSGEGDITASEIEPSFGDADYKKEVYEDNP